MNAFHPIRRSTASAIVLLLSVASQLVATGTANARTESVRWSHPAPDGVVRFVLQIGDASGAYTESQDLGKPTPDANGVFTGSFTVDDARSVYIALVAQGSSLASAPSNEQLRPGLTSGGTTTGGTTTGGTTTGGTTTTSATIENVGSADPATSGALARFDFANGTSGWTDTAANFGIYADDSLFSTASVGGNSALSTQSGSSDIHSHFTGTSSQFSNVTYRGRMALDSSSAGVGVTSYSLYTQYNRYYGLTAQPGAAFTVTAVPYGGLSCSSASTGVVPQPGKWYEFELGVESLSGSNRLTATVWLRGTQKPSTPQVTCTDSDSTRPASGRVGVWATGTGQKAWDDLEVISMGSSSGGGSTTTTVAPPVLISIEPVTP